MSRKGNKGNIPYNYCVVGVGCDNCEKGDMTLHNFIVANYKKFKEEKIREIWIEDIEYLQGVTLFLNEKDDEFSNSMELASILNDRPFDKFRLYQVIEYKRFGNIYRIKIKK